VADRFITVGPDTSFDYYYDHYPSHLSAIQAAVDNLVPWIYGDTRIQIASPNAEINPSYIYNPSAPSSDSVLFGDALNLDNDIGGKENNNWIILESFYPDSPTIISHENKYAVGGTYIYVPWVNGSCYAINNLQFINTDGGTLVPIGIDYASGVGQTSPILTRITNCSFVDISAPTIFSTDTSFHISNNDFKNITYLLWSLGGSPLIGTRGNFCNNKIHDSAVVGNSYLMEDQSSSLYALNIYNNLFYNLSATTMYGIILRLSRAAIYNNTFYNIISTGASSNTSSIITIFSPLAPYSRGNIVFNNIIDNCTWGVYSTNGCLSLSDYNCVTNCDNPYNGDWPIGNNDFTNDPLLEVGVSEDDSTFLFPRNPSVLTGGKPDFLGNPTHIGALPPSFLANTYSSINSLMGSASSGAF
jgi:hypothetical protein